MIYNIMLNGFNTRQFGWRNRGGSSSSIVSLTGLSADQVINYVSGDTNITNNSIESASIKGPDVYCNNIYEFTNNNKIHTQDDLVVHAALNVDTITPRIGSYVNVPALQSADFKADIISPINSFITLPDTHIDGNLTVMGTTTSLNSVQTNMLDNYIYLGSGQTINGNYSGGCIINRTPSATQYILSGSFVAGDSGLDATVGTVDESGLSPGQLVQISGSTSNDGIYEVQSHADNVLTIRGGLTPLVDLFCSQQFTSETAAGVVQAVAVSGCETANDGITLNFLTGSTVPLTRKAIAYHLSSPTFTDLTSDSLTLNSIANDNTQDKVLVMNSSGEVKYRSVASISSGLTYAGSTVNILPAITGCGLAGDDYAQIQIRVDPVIEETMFNVLGQFNITTVSAGAKLMLAMGGGDYLSSYKLVHPVLLEVGGLQEECYITHDIANTQYIIVRKNGSNFPAGVTVKSAMTNFPGLSFPLMNSWTFNKF